LTRPQTWVVSAGPAWPIRLPREGLAFYMRLVAIDITSVRCWGERVNCSEKLGVPKKIWDPAQVFVIYARLGHCVLMV
jgi:hypothetical protein